MNGLLEILTNKYWMIDPNAARAIRKTVERNLNGHVSVGSFPKRSSYLAAAGGEEIIDYAIFEDGGQTSSSRLDAIDTPFVNVIVVDGPVTRNGGACSYGSVEHRDMVIAAANNPLCRGHVFVINTPGGSAWAKNDYRQCIEYARAKGQPVYAFIDGMCASAGMYLAALCDKRFYMHPKNEIGCIGVLCAFYAEKDGDKNNFTNETYHEIYEPESYDKNKPYRDIINDGNDELLVAELVRLATEFRSDVKASCPNATDDHLHGKIFSAEDVKGILVDAQSTLGEVIDMCFNAYSDLHPTSNNSNMEEQYKVLAQACGVEELVMDSTGTHLDMSLVDNLTQKLNDDASAICAAEQQITELKIAQEEALGNLKNEHIDALAAMKSDFEAKIADLEVSNKSLSEQALNSEHNRAAVADLSEKLAKAQAEIASLGDSLAKTQQDLADREAQIDALTKQPSEMPMSSPENNGSGAHLLTLDSLPAYDSSLSPAENAAIRNRWKAEHGL